MSKAPNERRFIPAEEAFARWREDPEFVAAYDALEGPFAVYAARCHANLSRAELAERMGTSKAVISRLEDGWTMPSTRMLDRVAAATGTKLRVRFEPEAARGLSATSP